MSSRTPRLLGTATALAGGIVVLGLPGLIKRGRQRRSSVDGVVTLSDAVQACRSTGLSGWNLVAHAQRLVARKFAIYSLRNPWDSPSRAFVRGMGYCLQYNLALKHILQRLGFDSRLVHAVRVRDLDDPNWRMGHAWLRVRSGGEELDVCAGSERNFPGRMRIKPLTGVHDLPPALVALSYVGSALVAGAAEWQGVLKGTDPGWTFRPRC